MKTPYNFTTQKEYQGKNQMILAMTPFKDTAFAGYRQWIEAGYQVKKGSKGTKIQVVFTKKDKKSGKEVDKGITFKTVFNREQVMKIEDIA